MNTFPTRVLVAADRSDSARTALDAARELCAATDSELWLVHVKLLTGSVAGKPTGGGQYEKLEGEGEELLQALRDEVESDEGDVKVAQASVRLGKSIEGSVASHAEEIGARLIVVGGTTRGRVGRTVGGDVAVGLVKNAPCAVLVVPPHVGELYGEDAEA